MRSKLDTADLRVAELAARQHGVVSTRQLAAAGMSRAGIRRRTRSGRLHPLHRGVYAVGHSAISTHGRWMAAVLACGVDRTKADIREAGVTAASSFPILQLWGAALSHWSAARAWGILPLRREPVDVIVPSTAGRMGRKGIRLHRSRTLRPELVTSRSGIPVTMPGRTIADLRRTASPAEVRQAIRQAEVLGLRTEEEVETDRTRSELEALFLRLCDRFKLPAPEVNTPIGSFLVDFLWRENRLIVETDGYRHHGGREAFEADRDRDLRLKAMGYDVIRLSYRQVVDKPRAVADMLVRLLVNAQAHE